ncbi:class I SAM-dependent methyltransferase [Streptomyces sp. ET3-23]|uniref:SAM-dependent methyltransferase n=1 Tax=Streptomyces sp. ET3-23 TaxID=2885643 RepID=UPI001D120A5B|nr:class I SAM-dependent methyltransferase [Streptomyces sp. ET3-23]MCC2280891.1 class I SAM-dependent methyltransferase [Streptomyces sp. ET3-23]
MPSPTTELADNLDGQVVSRYYDAMTGKLTHKYGPGPRLHYHLGYYASGRAPDHPDGTPPQTIARSIWKHQEFHLREAARLWDAGSRFTGTVLDVGCGLGGGSIFWAQEYGANVTAVTLAPEHPPILGDFARRAGVGGQIETLVCDATEVPADRLYDTAVAIESSCQIRRGPWFRHLARLLKPGGSVCIEDIFAIRPRGAAVWADYFHARPGTLAEYVTAAKAAGFALADNTDITTRTTPFWQESIAWTRALLDGPGSENLDSEERRRLRISLIVHHALEREWKSGGMRQAFLRFERRT